MKYKIPHSEVVLISVVIVLVAIFTLLRYSNSNTTNNSKPKATPSKTLMSPTIAPTTPPSPTPSPINNISYDVPFILQAPNAAWHIPEYQDGCEEASSLMAISWARSEKILDSKKILDQIIAFEENKYNTSQDTSASDTAQRILKSYFSFNDFQVKNFQNIREITTQLEQGHIILFPMDGKALKNPNFKNGGPDRHMLVVKGFDHARQKISTNDPGTRMGDGYEYPYEIFWNAIRDYPSGNHEPIFGREKTGIIITKR